MRHSEKKIRNSEKKRKTGPLIVLVLEILVIIVMHAVKIDKTGASMQTVAGMQQFPAGRVLWGTPNSSRHVPELFEDCLTAVAEAKTVRRVVVPKAPNKKPRKTAGLSL
jgi:hypothetical protein